MGGEEEDFLVPVPPNPYFEAPKTDEKSALVLNVVMPPPSKEKKPVLLYVHGGSLLFGGSHLSIFDCVNLVSHSVLIGKPIIAVTFNYRVGLGGFLAGSIIENELKQDGHSGSGNFGFTDQQVAFEWINRHISFFDGDRDNVTAVGESAGGISISHQLIARIQPKFNRAICMSGLAMAIPSWSIEEHDKLFEATCRQFEIDPIAADALDRLRRVPEQKLADATPAIQGVPCGTGNPCFDDWFHQKDPALSHEPPNWLKSYMLGDTYHEGIIFHSNILEDDYYFFHSTLLHFIEDLQQLNEILELYEIHPSTPHDLLLKRFEHMCGDAIFKIPNYVTARHAEKLQELRSLFTYHFDQRSRLKNPLEGTAYHAIDLLYLFLNLSNEMDQDEQAMAKAFAAALITFAYGQDAWEGGPEKWMVWGTESKFRVLDEVDDEALRGYERFRKILSMGSGKTWKKWAIGVDAIVNKRTNLGNAL